MTDEQYIVQADASARRQDILRCILKIITAVERPTRLSLYTNDQQLHSTIDDAVPLEQRRRLEYFGLFRIRQAYEDEEVFGLA